VVTVKVIQREQQSRYLTISLLHIWLKELSTDIDSKSLEFSDHVLFHLFKGVCKEWSMGYIIEFGTTHIQLD